MRKVILQEFVTLDGLAAGPDDSTAFVPASMRGDQSFGREQLAFVDTIGTILLGRKTYQMFASHFPNVTDKDEKPFADRLNNLPKIVFSKTLDRAPWGQWNNATIARRTPPEEVAHLKQQPGKDIVVWGSLSVVESLIKARLIDEYRLVICPVVLGSGRPLFRDKIEGLAMKLLQTKSYDRGAVLLQYAPDHDRSPIGEVAAGAGASSR